MLTDSKLAQVSLVFGLMTRPIIAAGLASLFLLACLAGCGGGGSGLVIPPVTTGQSVIQVEVRADSDQTLLATAGLNVLGGGSPQVSSTEPGKFKVTVAPGASYQLVAGAPGYASLSRMVNIPARNGLACSVTQVSLSLPRALPTITLTPTGGDQSAGEGVQVKVPAGAVSSTITAALVIKSLTATGGSGAAEAPVLGTVELLPAGTTFATPVHLIIPRDLLKVADALVTAGSTFQLWEAGATPGQFVASSGTAVYRSASDDFDLALPHTGAYQLRPGYTVRLVGDLTRDLGTAKSDTGGSILEGAVTADYSTSSSTSDPAMSAILTATFGTAPGVDLSAANPPVPGVDGFITEITVKQTGQRVAIYQGDTLVGTVEYYSPDIIVMAVHAPPPRTGTG